MSELALLEALRAKIDAMDDRLVALLNERSAVVLEIGKIKKRNNAHFHTPAREQAIYDRLTANNPGPFPNESLKHVFREIMGGSLSLEKEMRAAYVGPEESLSHQACLKRFSASVITTPVKSIQEVFEAVESGQTDFGMVPIENTTEGMVNDTLDLFVNSHLLIYGEVIIEENRVRPSRGAYPLKNETRFWIVSKKPSERTTRDKTSLCFSIKDVSKDAHGTLYHLLSPFDKRGIDLIGFSVRPTRKKLGEYLLYIDISGHQAEEKIHSALDEIKKNAFSLKVLGSYPMAGDPP